MHHTRSFPVKERSASPLLGCLEFSFLSLPSVGLSTMLASLGSGRVDGELSSGVCGCMDWKCLSLI